MAEFKTNVYRIFDKEKLPYTPHTYPHEHDDPVDGVTVANSMGIPVERVFKTLVTHGSDRNYYVFDVPVARELDLKKAARAVGVKSVEMIHVSEINKVTGYIRGGCSPIGMKKKFPTYIDQSARQFDKITVSAGVRGAQLLIDVEELVKFVDAKLCQLV